MKLKFLILLLTISQNAVIGWPFSGKDLAVPLIIITAPISAPVIGGIYGTVYLHQRYKRYRYKQYEKKRNDIRAKEVARQNASRLSEDPEIAFSQLQYKNSHFKLLPKEIVLMVTHNYASTNTIVSDH